MTYIALFVVLCIIALVTSAVGEKTTNLRGDATVSSTTATVTVEEAKTLESNSNEVTIQGRGHRDTKDHPTSGEVMKALDDWGKGLVSIAMAKANNGDYAAVARSMITKAYNYDNGLVLFKPTVAAAIPFRTTFDGALSYFVGGNADFPEDKGFALSPYKSVGFEIVGILYDTNRAIVQTKTTFTKTDESQVKAYFSMSFTRESKKDSLKIDLHHSSLPPVAY